MSDSVTTVFAVETRAALAGVHTGRFGASGGDAGISLSALPEGFVLHLLAKPFDKGGETRAEAIAARFGARLRPTAPGQWYVAGNTTLSSSDMQALVAEFGADIAVSDQSHGRVRIAVSGRDVEVVLAKLMAADLALSAFPVEHGTTLFAGHVSVHAQRVASDAFELMVLRGFAVDLFESLVQASLEFGVECRVQPA